MGRGQHRNPQPADPRLVAVRSLDSSIFELMIDILGQSFDFTTQNLTMFENHCLMFDVMIPQYVVRILYHIIYKHQEICPT